MLAIVKKLIVNTIKNNLGDPAKRWAMFNAIFDYADTIAAETVTKLDDYLLAFLRAAGRDEDARAMIDADIDRLLDRLSAAKGGRLAASAVSSAVSSDTEIAAHAQVLSERLGIEVADIETAYAELVA